MNLSLHAWGLVYEHFLHAWGLVYEPSLPAWGLTSLHAWGLVLRLSSPSSAIQHLQYHLGELMGVARWTDRFGHLGITESAVYGEHASIALTYCCFL